MTENQLSTDQLSRRQMLGRTAAGGAVLLGGPALLAACGSDTATETTQAPGTQGTAAPGTTAAMTEEMTGDMTETTSTVTFGSNYSDENPIAGLTAAIGSLPNKSIDVQVNTQDHNTYQENINTYLQAPDDIIPWFAGFRMRFFANQGLVGDISDVWNNVDGQSEGFKTASTGDDGKQYFVPFNYYTWAVNYSKSMFADMGYTEPTTLDELKTLATQMQSDGITPFAFANDGEWPIMGTFDILNMRINGYDFHISLMGGNESWTDDRVKAVFTQWEELLPFHQEGANGREWQEGAVAIEEGTAGMYLLGTFAASAMTDEGAADMDFFPFPEINPEHGRDAIEAPIDGFMMAANPENAEGAKEVLLHLSSAAAQDAYLSEDPTVVAANGGADTSVYNDLQKKSAQLASEAKFVSQFLDRDTIPEFASNVMGPALADFIANPSGIDGILSDVEDQKQVIFAS